jgi:DNA sulfur modification protein DndD
MNEKKHEKIIDEIHLVKFGKFRDMSFKFSRVTLFYGENEAGKTTLFDALLTGLCNMPKTVKLAKEINQRYGEDCRIILKYSQEGFEKYDLNEFMNLFAIRSGDISFKLSEGDYLEKIKAGLFSGGIDPALLIDKFEKLSSDDKKLAHNRELAETMSLKTECRKNLEKMEDERLKISERETENDAKKKSLVSLKAEINNLVIIKNRLEQKIIFEEKIRERRYFTGILSDIYKMTAIENRGVSGTENELKSVMDNEKELNAIRNKMISEEEIILTLHSEIDRIEENRTNDAFLPSPEILTAFIERLAVYRKNPYSREKVILRMPLFISGFAFSIISAIPAFFTGFKWIFFISLTVFFATVLLSVRKKRMADHDKENRYVDGLKDDFYNRTGYSLQSNTPDGIYDELLNMRNEMENAGKRRAEKESAADELKKRISKIELMKKGQQAALSRIKNDLDILYSKNGVTGYEEYLEKKNRDLALADNLEDLGSRTRKYMNELDKTSVSELKTECERKLRSFDEYHIPENGISGADLGSLKMKLKKADEMLESLNETRENLEKQIAGNTENIKASYGNLPDRIVEAANMMGKLERKIDEIGLKKKAASILKGIFEEISAGSDSMLKELSHELKTHFAMIMPEMRDVKLKYLDENSISLHDAGGTFRPIDRLSKGTRESFLFAARLMFALKSCGEKQQVMILDEPFHSFDAAREKKSLEMLEYFTKNFGWQIILLTKEKRIADESKTVFKDGLTVYDL